MMHQLKRLPLWILFAVIVVPAALLSGIVHTIIVGWIAGRTIAGELSTWLVTPAPPKPIKLTPVAGQREHHIQPNSPW